MNIKHFIVAISLGLIAVLPLTSIAKSVPGDGAKPVVELMPIVTRHEAALDLSAEQIAAIEAFRKEAMPVRLLVQQEILDKRAALRTAILEDKPASERADLMREIADTEVRHFEGRNRCAEFLRTTLTGAQYDEVVRLYLEALR